MRKKLSWSVETIIAIFFLLQPLFSMYRTFFGDNIKIVGFSLFELINTCMILFIFLLGCMRLKHKKKLIYVGLFLFLVGVYCVIHYYNLSRFDQSIINLDQYGFIKESYYIGRIYIFPILLMIGCIFLNIDKKKLMDAVSNMAIFIACIIVITNLLTLSLCTYHTEFHEYIIQGNLFDWFTLNGTEFMKNFTSIGWFEDGNEISAILLVSAPYILYKAFYIRNFKSLFYASISFLAMLMLGTKTAVFGSILVFVVLFVYFVGTTAFSKNTLLLKKVAKSSFIFVVIWGILIYYSPLYREMFPRVNGTKEQSDVTEAIKVGDERENILNPELKLSLDSEQDRNYALAYMQNNFWNHYIQEQMVQRYPFESDMPYYIEVFNRPPASNINSRFYRQHFINRIIERNNRPLDKYVGIGVLQNFNIERDYVYQYFMFGIVGVVLLLGIYILIFVKGGLLFFIRKDLRQCSFYFTMLMCAGIALLLPYASGHMFDYPMVMFGVALVLGVLYKMMEKKYDEKDSVSTGA